MACLLQHQNFTLVQDVEAGAFVARLLQLMLLSHVFLKQLSLADKFN